MVKCEECLQEFEERKKLTDAHKEQMKKAEKEKSEVEAQCKVRFDSMENRLKEMEERLAAAMAAKEEAVKNADKYQRELDGIKETQKHW